MNKKRFIFTGARNKKLSILYQDLEQESKEGVRRVVKNKNKISTP